MAIHTIEDLREAARRRLPKAVFDTIDGGSGSEEALRRNQAAFAQVGILPRALVGCDAPACATTLCGSEAALPVVIGPTGMSGLYWPQGEFAMARAAEAHGIIYTLSCIASVELEAVAAATAAPKWFQLYLFEDQALMLSLIGRAVAAGYAALVVTVDTPVVGQRLRDIRSGLAIPPKISPAFLASMLAHPGWSRPFVLGQRPKPLNLTGTSDGAGYRGLPAFEQAASWESLAAIRRAWPGPLVVKGIMHPADVAAAEACGADAVVLSNHGGRQLDISCSTLAALRGIGETKCEIYFDGGIRSGGDVLKAMALGAKAVLLGRAPLFGLAAGGERLASRAIEIIASELKRSMILAGCPGVDSARGIQLVSEAGGTP